MYDADSPTSIIRVHISIYKKKKQGPFNKQLVFIRRPSVWGKVHHVIYECNLSASVWFIIRTGAGERISRKIIFIC